MNMLFLLGQPSIGAPLAFIITHILLKENDFFIFFQWGFDEGGDISYTLSLAQLSSTYRGGGYRTPRYYVKVFFEVLQDVIEVNLKNVYG